MQRRSVFYGCAIFVSAFLAFYPVGTRAQTALEATVYVDRAVLAYTEERFQDALAELNEALRLNPESAEALYYQGLVYLALKRPREAQASLETAWRIRPRDHGIAFQLAVIYFNQQEYKKAEPLFRQVRAADPRRQNLGYYLGVIEYQKGNHRAAIDLFRANVPSDDASAQLSRFYAGLAMSALGFPRQAAAEIEEAMRLRPLSPLADPARRFGEAFAKAAEKERGFRGEIRLGIFYDSNVPVVPDSSSNSAAQALRNRSKTTSEGELVSIHLAYAWLRSLDWDGTLSYSFLQTYNNQIPHFNLQNHRPAVAMAHRGAVGPMPYSIGLQAAYDFLTLGNSRFTQGGIVAPYITLVEDPRNFTMLQFRLQAKDFFDDREVTRRDVRDAMNYMIGPLHYFLLSGGRHHLKIGYQYDIEAAEGENWSYRGNRLLFGGQYTLPWGDVRLRYDLALHWRLHKHRHSLIPAAAQGTTRRRDREPIHLVSVAKDFTFENQPFTLAIEYLFDDNASNLEPFDYRRHVVTTSLTWRF